MKKNIKNQINGEVIKASQALIHIKHTITVRQYKYWFLLMKFYREMLEINEPADERGFRFVPIAKIAEYMGYEPQKYELKEDFRALRQEPIVVNYLEKDGNSAMHEMGFISEYKITSKRIGFKFPSLIDEVIREREDVKQLFLMLDWNVFNSFTGKYEAIIYKLCKDYVGIGRTPYFTVQEFREYIGLNPDEYLIFKELNRKTISNPLKNINENKIADISVEVEFKRQGRKVIGLHFKITRKQLALPMLDFEPSPAFREAKIAIMPVQQSQYMMQYAEPEIMAIIARANAYIKDLKEKGKAVNIGAIYKKAFEEGWGLAELAAAAEQAAAEAEKQKKAKAEQAKQKRREAAEQKKQEQLKQKLLDEFYTLDESEQAERIEQSIKQAPYAMKGVLKNHFEKYGLSVIANPVFFAQYNRIFGAK